MFSEQVQSRAEQREETRKRVLLAAEELFRQRGFNATTIREIATEAGVSTGTVMAAGDKDALLVEIFDNWIDDTHRTRNSDADRAVIGRMDPVEDVLNLFKPFIAYFVADRDLSRHYAAIIVRGRHESQIFKQLAHSLIAEIRHTLEDSGAARSTAAPGAKVIYFAYLGLLMTVANGALHEEEALHQLHDVVQFVVTDQGASK